MDESVKTYRICYRMECFVEASNEDEAKYMFQEGQGDDAEYVEFMSIEEVNINHQRIEQK